MKKMLLLLFLLLAATSGFADQYFYAVNTNQDLYIVDVNTGAKTLVGPTGVFLEGLAIDGSGNLFGTGSNGNLYSLNTSTGAATLIGGVGIGNIEGLDFNGSTLLGTDFNNAPSLYSIDTGSGAPTLQSTFDQFTGLVRSMTVLNEREVLVRTDNDPAGNSGDFLWREIIGGGGTTFIGALASPCQGVAFAAMDFGTDGNLYGMDCAGNTFSIDPTTAATTLLGNTGDDFWLDMTNAPAPVPEPGTLALFGSGLIAMGGAVRRKFNL